MDQYGMSLTFNIMNVLHRDVEQSAVRADDQPFLLLGHILFHLVQILLQQSPIHRFAQKSAEIGLMEKNLLHKTLCVTGNIDHFGVRSDAIKLFRCLNATFIPVPVNVHQNRIIRCSAADCIQKIFQFLTNVNNDSYGTFLGIDKTDDVSGQTVTSGTVIEFKDGIISLLNDCRHCVTDSNEHIIETLKKNADAYDFDVVVKGQSKPYFIDKNGPIVKIITQIYQDWTQTDGAPQISKGGTYAGKIPNSVAVIGDYAFWLCSSELKIYCKASFKPSGWSSSWNYSNRPVVWNYTGN
jgi:hypothetical protein